MEAFHIYTEKLTNTKYPDKWLHIIIGLPGEDVPDVVGKIRATPGLVVCDLV